MFYVLKTVNAGVKQTVPMHQATVDYQTPLSCYFEGCMCWLLTNLVEQAGDKPRSVAGIGMLRVLSLYETLEVSRELAKHWGSPSTFSSSSRRILAFSASHGVVEEPGAPVR